MPQTWITADLHLGHDHVAKVRGFANAAKHDAALAATWRRRVRDGDTVWVLGDVALGGWRDHIGLIGTLPGIKHLVLGNHDRAFPGIRGWQHHQRAFLEHFETVSSAGSVRFDGRTWLLSHFPYDGDHPGIDDREEQWRPRDLGQPLLHGHTHSGEKVSFSREGSWQVCVSLDAWGMAPALLADATRCLDDTFGVPTTDDILERCKTELRSLVRRAVVPAEVPNLSSVHDHIDANMLGFDEQLMDALGWETERGQRYDTNHRAAHDRLNTWLQQGGIFE